MGNFGISQWEIFPQNDEAYAVISSNDFGHAKYSFPWISLINETYDFYLFFSSHENVFASKTQRENWEKKFEKYRRPEE